MCQGVQVQGSWHVLARDKHRLLVVKIFTKYSCVEVTLIIPKANVANMEVEEVLKRIGFGWPQKKLYMLIQLIHYPSSFHFIALSFIGFEPLWTCGESNDLVNKCMSYHLGDCEVEYEKGITTVITEWNLICDKSSLAKLSQSMFFVGAMLGAWVWGTLSDRMGRRKIYFITAVLSAATGMGYSLAPNYFIFVIFRSLSAFSVAGLILSSFVLSIELTATKGRTEIVMLSGAVYSICPAVLAIQSYFVTNWRWFGSIASLSGLLILFLLRVIPESPRWLLVNGQERDAENVLAKLALDNGVEMPAGRLKKPTTSSTTEPVSVLDLFKGKIIFQRTLILFLAWFSNSMVYYALTMSAGELGGNRYINIALAGLVEIPSFVAGFFFLDRIGRRRLHGGFLTMAGVACLAVAYMQQFGYSKTLVVVTAMIGKLAVSGSFAFVYMYSAELFPTQVRNIGAGVVTIGARVGGFFSPIVLLATGYGVGLPMLVLGAVSSMTGLLSFTLPETLNQPMLETLHELEHR